MNYILFPHLPQKDLPGFILFPQFGHIIASAELFVVGESAVSNLFPQYLQNFFVPLFSFPQEAQIMIVVGSLLTICSVDIFSEGTSSSVVSSETVLSTSIS